MVGIIGAMDVEIDGIKAEMTEVSVKTVAGLDFYKGYLNGVPCVTARCNPGKVNAAACAQIMALEYRPRLIINPGVAGGIGPDVHIGDVVIGTNCLQHDIDTSFFGDAIGFISGVGIVKTPCDPGTLKTLENHAKKIFKGKVMPGTIVTGDQFINYSAKCAQLHRDFGALACEMESGAIAHICYINQIPFAAVRSISDNADDDAGADYMTFVQTAAKDAIELINSVITEI